MSCECKGSDDGRDGRGERFLSCKHHPIDQDREDRAGQDQVAFSPRAPRSPERAGNRTSVRAMRREW
jgi:hypothetical protein